jgi:FSR family fosmidomycin resistance protein-like MFS transporter
MAVIEAAARIPARQTRFSQQQRSLAGACLAHFLHDGYTDQLYALLPIWQSQFGLSYAGLAMVRALYNGTMGGLQIAGNRLTRGLGPRLVLVSATVIAAFGFLAMALPGGFAGLCVGLVVAGVGSSLQHPRASLVVTSSFGRAARGPLGIYNFSGDLGKAVFPASVALLLTLAAWRPIVGLMAMIGMGVAGALPFLLPRRADAVAVPETHALGTGSGKGFRLLLAIGALDTATRMGYLLFLPFLIHAKGGKEIAVGAGLALLFAGGALGKASCGWLGKRFGVIWTVIVTEAATGVIILSTLLLPLWPMLVVLPLLGMFLNGTSSVLYGTVPELAPRNDIGRAFAMFYTGVIGAGGLAPIGYGFVADHSSRSFGIALAALTALVIVPLVLLLRPALSLSHQMEVR